MQERTYKINDITKGLYSANVEITATSPRSALIKAGYKEYERDYTNTGNIIVCSYYDGEYKSFVYRKKY